MPGEDFSGNPGFGTGGGVLGSGGAVLGSGGELGAGALDGSGGNGVVGTGGVGATGGTNPGTGGSQVELPPVDCSAIGASWDLCGSAIDSCTAVFTDSAGCAAVCASAGLVCSEVWEDVTDACEPDTALPQLGCEPASGHQSDYCVCVRDGSAGGTGGAPATGGAAATGGAPATGGAASTGGAPATGGTASTGGSPGTGGTTGNAPCDVPDYIFSDTTPVGWASQSGGTTGGGNASPVLVTTLSQLQNEVKGTTPKVIYVQGTLSPGEYDVGSNKTIIGCSSGAHVRGTVKIGSGSSNIIMRNLNVSGYAAGSCALDPDYDSGEGCSSGNDAIGVNGNAHHVWFDHCSVKDGADGNLDITNNADFVTVSWTKFSYTPRTDNQGDDSTGAAGHRYSNLVGGTDTAPSGFPGTRPLNVTWHHNWWADGVVERQPRVRYGRNHLFNNYYNSASTNYCVRAGIEARILLQGNYFDGVKDPHEFNSSSNQTTANISRSGGAQQNIYNGTSGDQSTGGGGDAWTNPPYSYSVDAASTVPNAVKAGAGPH